MNELFKKMRSNQLFKQANTSLEESYFKKLKKRLTRNKVFFLLIHLEININKVVR